ncbi:MAG: MBOAT family protein [Bacteroidales bacterium]|nr:MBOAT family protein [Bacteroidales bacterium]
MLFNSLEFLIFLPIVFILYWFVFRQLKIQNLFIVIASYIFYGWWDKEFLILIAITSLLSYLSGIVIEKFEGKRLWQKVISASNIILNIGILGYFKYCNFFGESFAQMLNSLGINVDWVTLDIILPVGISFYTFQALSYSIDVYRGKIKATRDIVAFFAYISFFPQLVAGPIERATNLLPQMLKKRSFDYSLAVDGCRQIIWGFFKKMVVADNCAIAVDTIWGNYQNESGFTLMMGGVFFAFQIYGDFSGYSDIAIGSAKLFGINLKQNFNFPYFSRNIAEFWRRWHISLTTWFKDYLYIPLGGSKCSMPRVILNTFIIFTVSGIWHGANWTFIVWGVYNALLFIPLLLTKQNRKYLDVVAKDRVLPTFKELSQITLTFILAVFGWIIFRSASIEEAIEFISIILSSSVLDIGLPYGKGALVAIAFMLIVEWFNRDKSYGLQISGSGVFKYSAIRWCIYYGIIIATILFMSANKSFIYFQF